MTSWDETVLEPFNLKQGRSLDLGVGYNCCDLCCKRGSLQTPCESWSWLQLMKLQIFYLLLILSSVILFFNWLHSWLWVIIPHIWFWVFDRKSSYKCKELTDLQIIYKFQIWICCSGGKSEGYVL